MSDKPPLIGTGFYADPDSFNSKKKFFELWVKRNVQEGDKEFVIIDNGNYSDTSSAIGHLDLERRLLDHISCERLRIFNNLGHVGSWLNNPAAPQLLGWSMSWIIPAMIAYSERRDFVYIEQDCLAFGNWLDVILNDAKTRNLGVAIGHCPPEIAACEQSLFWISCNIIPHFVAAYMDINESDAEMLPENKFVKLMMEQPHLRIGYHSLPCGRGRPLPYDAPAWYAQKFSPAELVELKKRGMI